MKKLLTILLSLVMLLSLTTTAFAVTGNYEDDKGSITINKYNDENVYSIYQMLILKSFDTTSPGKYSYVVNSTAGQDWTDFFAVGGDGYEYITVVDGQFITWNSAKAEAEAALFAQKALAYAKANGITASDVSDDPAKSGQIIVDGQPVKTYTFDNLPLGYYLVDSTMGALCGLTTTNPNASINAKNGEPTIKKEVKEDSSGEWGTYNSVGIGQDIEYRITITTQPGAQNYVVHDDMDSHLCFVEDSLSVTYEGSTAELNTDYTFNVGEHTCAAEGTGKLNTCNLEITFTEAFCKTLGTNKHLVISYKATLDRNTFVPGDDNINSALLAFGDDHFSQVSSVNTKTFAFDLVKTDGQNMPLAGVKFKLYTTNDPLATPVKLFWVDAGANSYYRPFVDGVDTGAADVEFVTQLGVKKIRFQGFNPGEYYFEETYTPEGYNGLTARANFTLSDANKDAIFNDEVYSVGSGFHIVNQSGTMLPETGGIGTLLFTVLGGSTALGTGVVLVTKKRMSKIEDDED